MASSTFFESVIGAGAILAGFCGTFLVFRIQREAACYRQPALGFESQSALGRTHFTPAFLLLLLATAAALVFGLLFRFSQLPDSEAPLISVPAVVSGLLAAVTLLAGYFAAELVHYAIVSARLLDDISEWRKGRVDVLVTIVLAVVLAAIAHTCSA